MMNTFAEFVSVLFGGVWDILSIHVPLIDIPFYVLLFIPSLVAVLIWLFRFVVSRGSEGTSR